MAAARADGNPFLISWALHGLARAFINIDPARALGALRDGLRHNHEQRQASGRPSWPETPPASKPPTASPTTPSPSPTPRSTPSTGQVTS